MTTYAMDKLDAETVKLNFLPEDLSPSAIWGRMMLHIRETERQRKGNNEFKKAVLALLLSRSDEELAVIERAYRDLGEILRQRKGE